MVLQARRLGQPDSLQAACHSYKKKQVYLTGKRITLLFQEAVKAIHPMTSKAGLAWYLAHSLIVWACVLLDKAGMSPEFIKSCLRWMVISFWMYICDTGIIQNKHCNILQLLAALQEVIDLITGSLVTTPDILGMSTVEMKNTMGNYIDNMD